MQKCSLILLALLVSAVPAGAQEFPSQPYDFLLARAAASEGRIDEALKLMDRVVASEPGNPVVLYERAMMLIDAGRIARAEEELRAIALAHPEFYDANRVLGRILLDRAGSDRDKLGEALGYLQAAFKAAPDDFATGLTVSQILTNMGRVDEAEKVLATLVERSPDQRAINYTYAQVLTRLGRGSESRKYLERVIAIDPTFSPAVMQLLDIYQQANEWLHAADLLQPMIDADPMNLEMQRQQAYFHLRAGDAERARDRFKALLAVEPDDARSLFYLAESLNDLEEYAEAELIFRKLLAATPDDADLLTSLGLSLTGQKKWPEAADTFNKLLVAPRVADNLVALARTQLAYIDLQKGNYEAAVATASTIVVFRDKPNTQAINIALDALRRQKKPAQAVGLLAPIVGRYPSDPFVNARYVEALVRAGEKAKAKEQATAHARLGTRNTIAVAEAYVQAEDHASAIEMLKASVAAKPDDIDLQFELASLHERAGDRRTAETIFLSLLAKSPEHAPTLNYLGYMWAEGGVNLERAQEMLTRAVGQEPKNGAYVDSLGWVYFRLGNLELAEKYLTDAARLVPRDATVREHLGDVLALRGDMARALEQYRAALSLDPEAKEVEKLRSKIAELERKEQTSRR